MTTTHMPNKTNHGKNIRRFREWGEMGQKALAQELQSATGEEWNQRRISWLEGKESVELELLMQVATVLKVDVKYLQNMTDEAATNYFNTFEDAVTSNGGAIGGSNTNNNCAFNPLDKYAEVVEKNDKLYQALLKEKDEKIALLEKLLSGKN